MKISAMELNKTVSGNYNKVKSFITSKGGWDDAYDGLAYAYANYLCDFIRLTEELDAEGLVTTAGDGSEKRNPKEMIRNAAFNSMLAAAKELGITRVAEFRLDTKAEAKKSDPIASLRRMG